MVRRNDAHGRLDDAARAGWLYYVAGRTQDEIAAAMKSPKLKGTRFLIEGHTCDLGEDDYNLQLSAQRAETIRKLLVRKGVAADRLAVLGFGETELVEQATAQALHPLSLYRQNIFEILGQGPTWQRHD